MCYEGWREKKNKKKNKKSRRLVNDLILLSSTEKNETQGGSWFFLNAFIELYVKVGMKEVRGSLYLTATLPGLNKEHK